MKKVFFLIITAFLLIAVTEAQVPQKNKASNSQKLYEAETADLVAFVRKAADLIRMEGETAFNDFNQTGSPWRHEETYIFVLDPEGNMLVHPDPDLQGRNQINLKDVNGKPIIPGLLEAASANSEKPYGWYHYEWTVPGGLLPRWKSSYVQFVKSPAGKGYIVGSGVYNDRMERTFVIDMVKNAVGQIEKNAEAAFKAFHDPTGLFIAKDAYIFVLDPNGLELVNPAFPSLEGRNVLDMKDTEGKFLVREMLQVVKTRGAGWVDYMWPKPGESVSTLKSTYVSKAKIGKKWVLVTCGVYLADAAKEISGVKRMSAAELTILVRDAAAVFEMKGENAFPEFRKKGTKWFHDDSYFFVWTLDGIRTFHAANPAGEGLNVSGMKDVLGRPWGKQFLDVAASPKGEGWVHYMYPEPGDIFPTWKSSFLKRVTFPSGKQYLVGCGIYHMDMDKAFIEDVVNRAALLVEEKGMGAFSQLRDKTGPFVFMDTYVFVDSPDGTELLNPAQPSLEGKRLMDLKDLKGKFIVQDYIRIALEKGSGWIDYYWYQPGNNTLALKKTYVRKAQFNGQTYIIGSGLYVK